MGAADLRVLPKADPRIKRAKTFQKLLFSKHTGMGAPRRPGFVNFFPLTDQHVGLGSLRIRVGIGLSGASMASGKKEVARMPLAVVPAEPPAYHHGPTRQYHIPNNKGG